MGKRWGCESDEFGFIGNENSMGAGGIILRETNDRVEVMEEWGDKNGVIGLPDT